MSILGAENYLDGNTLFVAQSLAEMAQQQPGTRQVSQVAGMGYTFEMTRERAVTPEALNARMAGGVRRRLSASMDRRSNNDVEMANSPPPDNQAGKRKRKRKTSPEGEDGEEDGEKKSRGRPRLETKDETAADVGVLLLTHSVFSLTLWCIDSVIVSAYVYIFLPLLASMASLPKPLSLPVVTYLIPT